MVPIFLIGGLTIGSRRRVHEGRHRAGLHLHRRAGRGAGRAPPRRVQAALVKGLDVGYGSVQVLFGVDFEVDEGEIVALLGTNGAGKSTLLKAISGLVEADGGAIIFDGRDITHAPPDEIAALGIVQVPGGKGVFPSLTVAENLQVGGLAAPEGQGLPRGRRSRRCSSSSRCCADRWDEPAGNLSGGQQQMLALGMAFLAKPKLLMIDELSLGLAPVIVEQLLADRAGHPRPRHHGHPGRAVGERRPHRGRHRLLHGEGRDPLPGADRRAARPARRAALGVPRGRRRGHRRHHAAARRPRSAGRPRTRAGPSPRSRPSPRWATPFADAARRARRARHRRSGSAASGPSSDVSFGLRPGRDPRHHRAQRRRQDDAVRPHLRLPHPDRGLGGARRARRHVGLARRARPARARPLLPGRPAVPVAHRRATIAVALER